MLSLLFFLHIFTYKTYKTSPKNKIEKITKKGKIKNILVVGYMCIEIYSSLNETIMNTHDAIIEKRKKQNDTKNTEAILSNEDRKLKFETSWNGYDTQMRREVKKKKKKPTEKYKTPTHNIISHNNTTPHSSSSSTRTNDRAERARAYSSNVSTRWIKRQNRLSKPKKQTTSVNWSRPF